MTIRLVIDALKSNLEFARDDVVEIPVPLVEVMIKQLERASLTESLEANTARIESTLRELVALKDLKDRAGKTDDYKKRRSIAWSRAKWALIGYQPNPDDRVPNDPPGKP